MFLAVDVGDDRFVLFAFGSSVQATQALGEVACYMKAARVCVSRRSQLCIPRPTAPASHTLQIHNKNSRVQFLSTQFEINNMQI